VFLHEMTTRMLDHGADVSRWIPARVASAARRGRLCLRWRACSVGYRLHALVERMSVL
jgi:hypothetical protein